MDYICSFLVYLTEMLQKHYHPESRKEEKEDKREEHYYYLPTIKEEKKRQSSWISPKILIPLLIAAVIGSVLVFVVFGGVLPHNAIPIADAGTFLS
jgi:hypothetical protein